MDQLAPFDWNQVRAFLTTAESGSLSAAARVLKLTQPTLSRQVAALERQLGLVLFERVGRSLALTEAGRQLLIHVRAMGDAAHRVAISASGQSQAVEGPVRITAIDVMCAHLLPPVLKQVASLAPGITIDLLASNDIEDLMRRSADIALRHVPPAQPELIGRRCPDMTLGLYASREFLDGHGRPALATDLARLPFIGYPGRAMEELLRELQARDLPLTPQSFRWNTGSLLVSWELVKSGLGVGVMFNEIAERTPGIERVLPDMRPLVAPMWLVAHRELHTSRRIRIVFDAIADLLG